MTSLRLPDGKIEWVCDSDDFRKLIRSRLGDDAANYLNDYIEETVEEAQYEADDAELKSYESDLEDKGNLLYDIKEELELLSGKIRDMKMSRHLREIVFTAINNIESEINKAT